MARVGGNLSSFVRQSCDLVQVRKSDVRVGDLVLVKTLNSVYAIRILDDSSCEVSGGWFDRKGRSPARTTITGCTWGGSVVKVDAVAVCGLCLEFGNRLVTSTIRSAFVLPRGSDN